MKILFVWLLLVFKRVEYDLKYSYVLQDDPEEKHYNADTVVTLREFPNISMTLADMFENIE